jgi:MOSC domain-containing protein YiiM
VVVIRQIFISPEHNFVGHYGAEPGNSPLIEKQRIECAAGKGLLGDRYFNHREDYKGQITFFSAEVFEKLCARFGIRDKPAGVLRRNVIVSDIDLLSLIGCDFEIQGVKFHGTQHCAPCEWMDVAFAPGAKEFLKSNAGLRAKILTDGSLAVGDARLVIHETASATPAP